MKTSLGLAYSTESDYDSRSLTLTDTIAFNEKNTELMIGASVADDTVSNSDRVIEWHKNTYDVILGVNQLLSRDTVLGVHFTYGWAVGYLNDVYKFVDLNGIITNESRPGHREKRAGELSLTQYLDRLNASIEGSYRLGNDTFGVTSHTVQLAWYQKMGKRFILSPLFRFYRQSAADFYDVAFTGNPKHYSSDYRLSEFYSISAGLQAVCKVTDRFSVDLAYERYYMHGTDGQTVQEMYPAANIVTVGLRLSF